MSLNLIDEGLINPEVLKRLAPGDIISVCYKNEGIRRRCKTDEIIRNVFFERLMTDLVYIIIPITFDVKEVNFVIVDSFNSQISSSFVSLVFSTFGYKEEMFNLMNQIIRMDNENIEEITFDDLNISTQNGYIRFTHGFAENNKMRVTMPKNLVLQALNILRNSDKDELLYVYKDGTILVTTEEEIMDLFNIDLQLTINYV
jgi:hypothetical protein